MQIFTVVIEEGYSAGSCCILAVLMKIKISHSSPSDRQTDHFSPFTETFEIVILPVIVRLSNS